MQRRDRRELAVDPAVGEHDDVDFLLLDQAPRHQAQLLHRLDEALLTARHAEQDRQHADPQARQIHAPHLRELVVAQDRPLELEAPAVRGLGVEQVALGSEPRLGRGDQLLADAVDRRVGHLREELLEIVVKQAGAVRQHRERRVVAHRAHGLDAVARHRREEHPLLLEAVAERHLPLQQAVRIGRWPFGRRRQVLEMHQVLVEPLSVRALGGDRALDFLVVDDAALHGVDQEHAAGLQSALQHDVLRRQVEHAGLRGHDDQVVLRHVVARRAQAVAIEHGADQPPVGERDGGGPVPGLHQARVVLVERALAVVHALVVRPGLRDHHHHRVRQRAARQHQELERVVEHPRVAAVRVDDRPDVRDVGAEGVGLEARLAGVHPVGVAAHGVDLAVVREVAVRVRAVPARKGVGAEPRMDERERRLDRRVLQVQEILVELPGEQHALEDDGAAREADDVPVLGSGHRRGADLVVGALADHVQLALEVELVGDRGIAPDEHLAHEGLAGSGGFAEHPVRHLHRAPAEHLLALGLHDLLEALLDQAPHGRVPGQEDDAAAVLTGRRQRKARLAAHFLVEGVRHLDQHAGAIAGVGFRTAGAAMIEILQDLQRLLQDPMRPAALDVDDETDAAGIVLEARVVESLRTRRANTPVRSVHATGRRLRTVLARRDAHGVSSV